MEAVRMLAAGGEQPSHSRAQLVASLSNDLDGPRRGQALQGLCDMLGDDRGTVPVATLLVHRCCWVFHLLVRLCACDERQQRFRCCK